MSSADRQRTYGSERGSALLIVFVFAAIVAITLYMELPVAAFEAQRQKEQLLVDAGNEYAHAVKLFFHKTGHYPTSFKDLEDTNRMRFLRRELPDPFTGKADWRLLHAGPGGVIIDSKVNPNPLGNNGQSGNGNTGSPNASGTAGGPSNTTAFPNGSNSPNTFGGSSSSTSSGFGSPFGSSSASPGNNSISSNTSSGADSSTPEVVVQQPRQRGPAIAANGSQTTANADSGADTASPPLPPDTPPGGNPTNTGAATSAVPPGTPLNGAPGLLTGGQASGQNGAAPDLKASMLGTAAPGSAQTSSFGSAGGFPSSQMGTLNSGNLAGVASKASGHSIKAVNDQSNYSLWEFYYDPRKDTAPGGVKMGAYSQQNASTPGQQTGPNGQNSGAFGSSSFGQTSGFGQGSGSAQGSGFGQSSSFGQGSSFGQSSFGNNSNSTNSSFGQNNGPGNTNQNPTTNNQQNPQ